MTGMIRYSPVWIGEAKTPGLLLGPLAVDPSLRGVGIGIELMTRTLDTAKQLGHRIVVLVGDEPYYGRVGFSRSAAHKLVLPGQNDQARLLALELTKDALTDASGILTPASDFSRFSNN
jgi:predicted N-acetyltransferase YhbS